MKGSPKKGTPSTTPAPSAEDEELSDLEHGAHSSSELSKKLPRKPDEEMEDYLERTGADRFKAMNDRLNKARSLNKIPGAKQM